MKKLRTYYLKYSNSINEQKKRIKKIQSSTESFKNVYENDNLINKNKLNEFYKKYKNNNSNEFKIQIDLEFTKERKVTKKSQVIIV